MTLRHGAKLATALFAGTAFFAAGQAFANGMGTPIEPAPEQPAPTVMVPEPAPVQPIAEPAPRVNWSGFYIGGHLGYGWGSGGDDETLIFDTNLDGTFSDTVNTSATPPVNAFGPGFCNGAAIGNNAAAGCEDDDDGGFDAGLRIGYDWQFDNFVVGALLEANYVDISDSVSGFSTTPAAYTFNRELNFLGAARLKAGFLLSDDFLLYGTGGIAYGDLDRSFTTTNGVNSFTDIGDTGGDGAWGWQLGGGGEYMLSDGFSVGIEYLYTSLSDDEYIVRAGPGTAPATNPFLIVDPAGTDIARSNDSFDIHSVRATAAFRF